MERKKEEKMKEEEKRKKTDDDSAAVEARITAIKTDPRVLLSLIHFHFCYSVSSNYTFLHIWPSSLFN